MYGYGILIEGEPKPERTPSEILPVFKFLKEPENYLPILMNMILDMIGCYRFPELRHESENMKARREFITNGAFEQSFGDIKAKSEEEYYALENNYYIFKETCIVASCSAILGRDKHLHDFCMKYCDAAMFGFQNESDEQSKRIEHAHGMAFIPYLQYFIANHLSDNNISRTVRLGACFLKVAAEAYPQYITCHDEKLDKFMYEGNLPEMLPVLQKSPELMRCQQLPLVMLAIYYTLEDYFNFLCPEAVLPRNSAQERVIFQRKGK